MRWRSFAGKALLCEPQIFALCPFEGGGVRVTDLRQVAGGEQVKGDLALFDWEGRRRVRGDVGDTVLIEVRRHGHGPVVVGMRP
jgi:hypothetical protein